MAIGQVGTFSGVAGPITAGAKAGLAAWVKDVNTRGGLACHPVRLFVEDDGGDASRAAFVAHQMVRDHGLISFVADVPLGMTGFRPAVEQEKVPAIGGAGTPAEYSSAWFFPDGASIDDLSVGIVKQGVEHGHKQIGFLYCVEAPECGQFNKRLHDGLAAKGGGQMVYDSPISVTQPDFTAQCLNARNAKADLLLLAMDGGSMSRVARSCDGIGYRPLLATGGAALTAAQATDPTLQKFGLVTVTAEAPWMVQDTPGLAALHTALARYAPAAPPDGAAVMAWTSGMLLETAITRIGEQAPTTTITPKSVLDGLGKIRHESLGGLTAQLSFVPNQPHATSSGCVFYELLTTSGWTAPRGSRPVCLGH